MARRDSRKTPEEMAIWYSENAARLAEMDRVQAEQRSLRETLKWLNSTHGNRKSDEHHEYKAAQYSLAKSIGCSVSRVPKNLSEAEMYRRKIKDHLSNQ